MESKDKVANELIQRISRFSITPLKEYEGLLFKCNIDTHFFYQAYAERLRSPWVLVRCDSVCVIYKRQKLKETSLSKRAYSQRSALTIATLAYEEYKRAAFVSVNNNYNQASSTTLSTNISRFEHARLQNSFFEDPNGYLCFDIVGENQFWISDFDLNFVQIMEQ